MHGDVEASGDDFSLRQGAGKSFRTPRDGFGVDGGYRTLRGFLLGYLGFLRDGEYMGEEAESEATWWAQTQGRRGHRASRAWPLSGQLAGLLQLPFWLCLRDGKIRSWVFVPCNSENICCRTFLKHKTAENRNWHCGTC